MNREQTKRLDELMQIQFKIFVEVENMIEQEDKYANNDYKNFRHRVFENIEYIKRLR